MNIDNNAFRKYSLRNIGLHVDFVFRLSVQQASFSEISLEQLLYCEAIHDYKIAPFPFPFLFESPSNQTKMQFWFTIRRNSSRSVNFRGAMLSNHGGTYQFSLGLQWTVSSTQEAARQSLDWNQDSKIGIKKHRCWRATSRRFRGDVAVCCIWSFSVMVGLPKYNS